MSENLKVEIGIALLALIHLVTAILREKWARQRAEATRAEIVKVQDSLRPPRDDTPVTFT